MARYAIIIGVEQYTHFSPTAFAHADASLLHYTLTESCDYAAQHTLLLKLDLDSATNPADVLTEIRRVVNGLQRGDSVLFYFAGHGHYSDNKTYLILPATIPGMYETTALGLDDISKELRVAHRSCFRLFDACHSGLDVRDDTGTPDSSSFVRAVTHDPSGWVTIAACRDDEFSVADPQIGQGIFTHYVCDYISKLKPNESVLPELLKVGISDQVGKHAKRLGSVQTPTLNASISGNISLACRKAKADAPMTSTISPPHEQLLRERINRLREVPEMFEKGYLENVLDRLITSVREELISKNDLLIGEVIAMPPMRADKIPDWMHEDVVNFAIQQGFQSRHGLIRTEEERPYPLLGAAALIEPWFPQKKVVHYDLWQPEELPDSAALLKVPGDGRCIPDISILVYVLPLQLTTCLLVSAYRQEWPPYKKLEFLCSSYQIEKPGMPVDHAAQLSPFAIKRIVEKLHGVVNSRVVQLEREIR